MTNIRRIVILAIALSVPARTVSASEWLLAPLAGATIRGATGFFDVDAAAGHHHPLYAVSVMRCGDGIVGVEAEGMWAPSFFTGHELVDSSRVMGASVSAVFMIPRRLLSSVRPYAVIGVGLMRAASADVRHVFDFDSTLPAFDAGAGILVPISRRFGMRGDMRFIRTSNSSGDGALGSGEGFLSMWRTAAGVSWSF